MKHLQLWQNFTTSCSEVHSFPWVQLTQWIAALQPHPPSLSRQRRSVALREPSLSSCSWLFHCIFVLVLFSPSESWLFFPWLPKRDSCHLQTQRTGCCHGISSVCGLETSVCEYSLSLLGMNPQMLLLFSPLFVSDSLQPCGLQSARLLCPWGF